ncbi:unnamed protein product [Effrenium voratum]|nr:unnamed protein product [Effrenium voratum]
MAPGMKPTLADCLCLLAPFLSLDLRCAFALCRACRAEDSERLWVELFQAVSVRLARGHRGAILRLPLGLRSLRLMLGLSPFADISAELQLLAQRLPQRLRTLTLWLGDASPQAQSALARSWPETLEELNLTMKLQPGVDLFRHMPARLRALSLKLGMFQEWPGQTWQNFVGGLPTHLEDLTLHLDETPDLALFHRLDGSLQRLSLDLGRCFEPEGLATAVQHLPGGLTRLRLGVESLTLSAAAAQALAQRLHPPLKELELDFEMCDFERGAATQLLRALPPLAALRLGLGGCEDLEPLVMPQLSLSLDLSECRVDAWCVGMAQRLPATLQELSLKFFDSDLGGAGVRALAQHLPRLPLSRCELSCGASRVPAADIEALMQALPASLETLILEFEWAELALTTPVLPARLKSLELCGSHSAPSGGASRSAAFAAGLRSALPRVQVLRLNFEHCRWPVASARWLLEGLPSSVSSLHLDFGGTEEEWCKLLQPLRTRFGEGIRIPQPRSRRESIFDFLGIPES